MQTVRGRNGHQLVPSGVELDLVDAVAISVMRAQHGRVGVGGNAPLQRLCASGPTAEIGQSLLVSTCAVPTYTLDEGGVGAEDVVVDKWRRLVLHLVSSRHALNDRLPLPDERGNSIRARRPGRLPHARRDDQ